MALRTLQMSSTFAESFVVVPLFLEDYSDPESKFLDGGTIRHMFPQCDT